MSAFENATRVLLRKGPDEVRTSLSISALGTEPITRRRVAAVGMSQEVERRCPAKRL